MSEKHTSILYVHGIGQQWRHEEISRLVDALAGYAAKNHLSDLQSVRTRLESSGREDGDIACIQVRGRSANGLQTTCRFYEAYWPPLTADSATSRSILGWLARCLLVPLQTLLRCPWRERQRLLFFEFLLLQWNT